MTAVFAMVNQISSYSIPPERQKQGEQVRASHSAFLRHGRDAASPCNSNICTVQNPLLMASDACDSALTECHYALRHLGHVTAWWQWDNMMQG